MKKVLSTIALLAVACLTTMAACEASFTYTISGNTVTFHGMSTEPGVTYHWNFGDQSDANGENVTHTYSQYPEHYQVCLTIHNSNTNCVDDHCETIYVQSGPINCEGVFTYTINNNNQVHFFGTSNAQGISYEWSFGDGSTANGNDPWHTYPPINEHYDVCMYTYQQSTGCRDTICQNIYIQATTCDANFTNFNSGLNVEFNGVPVSNNTTHLWDFGDGHSGSTIDPTHVYSHSGTYTVCHYTYNQTTNCSDTVCELVTALVDCDAEYTYTLNGSTYSFDSHSVSNGTVHYWDFGDGSVSNDADPNHTFTIPGTYNVCHFTLNQAGGCQDSACELIVYDLPPCEAAITYTIIDNQVHFFGTSNTPGVDYIWDFGDGQVATGDNDPWHTYSVYPEHYDVCLIIVNNNGCADTVCENIYIQNGPANCEGIFTYTVNGNEVNFYGTANVSSLVGYTWYFDDGSTGVGQNISHTYSVYPEHYNVCMVITNTATGCSDTTCQTVYIQSGPQNCQASFTYTINNNQVSFHGISNVNNVDYYWIFGDGEDANGQNLTHTYSQYPEHYDVCLVIHNTQTNCLDTVCETIYIQSGPNQNCQAIMSFNIVDNTVTFVGTSNVPNVDYHWIFGDGDDANGPTVTHTYSQYPEHYNVCLVIHNTALNCLDTVCETIYIQNGPSQNCEGAFTYTIQGNSVHFYGTSNVPGVNYTWIFGDGHLDSSNNNDPWHTYSVYPEHYNVCMIITNNSGCADTVCQNIYIPNNGSGNNCVASFSYLIDQNEVHFAGHSTEPNVDYHWIFGDGHDANGQNPTHVYSQYPEHYTVCLVIHNSQTNCLDTVCETIYIQGGGTGNNCQASFSYTINNNEVSFHGSSTEANVDYHWIFGDGHDANGQNVTHSYAHFPEHYSVCLVIHNTAFNCIDTVCQTIYVQNGVACNSEFTYTITGNQVYFHSASNSSGANYHWSFGDGSSSNDHNPHHHYTVFPEHYEVCLTVTNGNNCNTTTCHTVYIQGNNTNQYDLSGTVYAGNNFADQGTVHLIKYNPSLGTLQAVASTPIGPNGFFTFNASAGNYLLKAALSPNSLYYHHWLPTYYDHELWWSQADVISLNANMSRSVHLIEGINPGGPGFVAGLVTQGANKTNGPGDPVEDVLVMLLNMNDEPVQYTYSNANGEFSFSNLAYGTYKVWGEVLNLTTNPAIVTISELHQDVDDVNLWITDKEVTTGIYEQAVLNNASVGELFPNPTTGDALFYINLTENAELTLRVFDITGRQVYGDVLKLSNGDQRIYLPTTVLQPGVYSMVLTEEKANSVVNRKLVKLK